MTNQELWAQGVEDGFRNVVNETQEHPLYWEGVLEGDRRYKQWIATGRYDKREFGEVTKQVREDYGVPLGVSLNAAFAV